MMNELNGHIGDEMRQLVTIKAIVDSKDGISSDQVIINGYNPDTCVPVVNLFEVIDYLETEVVEDGG